MKKIILLLLVSLCGVSASAQLFFAGNLGFDRTDYSRSQGFDSTLPKGMRLQFTPMVGYTFSPVVKAGLLLNISNQKYTYTDGFYNNDDERWKESNVVDKTLMMAGLGAFVRVRCLEFKDVLLSMELSVSYQYGIGANRNKEFYSASNFPVVFKTPFNVGQLNVRLVPMFSYQLSNHLGVDAYVDVLSLAYSRKTVYTHKVIEVTPERIETSDSDLDYSTTTSDFNIGVSSLNSAFLSLGFSYTL